MNINSVSKYIILFLFAMLVVLSVLLGIEKASNNKLTKENARLTEMVVLRDAAISEIDKNIASLQEQVLEAESICNERLKARENLLTFLSIEPTYNVGKKQTPSEINLHNGSKKGSVAPFATELKQNNNIDSSPSAQNDKVVNKVGIKVIMLLIVLTVISACSSHTQVIVKNKQCAVPARVELKALDNSTHIGSEKNTAILMLNIADLVAYIKSLEAAIKCYTDSSPDKSGSE